MNTGAAEQKPPSRVTAPWKEGVINTYMQAYKDNPEYLPQGVKIKTPSQSMDVFMVKQSLGQNFVVNKNMERRIVDTLQEQSENGKCVVEVGPGKGSLSALLLEQYPQMKAIEIDQRSVEYLATVLPTLKVIKGSVLDTDWHHMSQEAGGEQLSVIGNLPYYITSQILFSIIDGAPSVRRAIVTMQLEVAERVCASHGCKAYGILSVVAQLHGKPSLLFQIPPTVFQPRPDVTSALVRVDFPAQRRDLGINECHLRTLLRAAFQQRRKMLRQSLKAVLSQHACTLDESVGTKRPEQLTPAEFVELTRHIFGPGVTPPGVAVWRGSLDDPSRTDDGADEGEGAEGEGL